MTLVALHNRRHRKAIARIDQINTIDGPAWKKNSLLSSFQHADVHNNTHTRARIYVQPRLNRVILSRSLHVCQKCRFIFLARLDEIFRL